MSEWPRPKVGRDESGYSAEVIDDVTALHRGFIEGWNRTDAAAIADLFADECSMVGFDGSCIEGRAGIEEHLTGNFGDHRPARYLGKVREVRPVGDGAAVLRAVMGMVPPGADDIKPDVNAVQVLVATRERDGRWRIAHLQTTPAQFHGRPDAVEGLTAELRQVLAAESIGS